MVKALREAGYELNVPDGTFYVLVRSPWADMDAFVEHLARQGVLVLPGSTFEMPRHFRISVTASDEMIERALPVFASAIAMILVLAGLAATSIISPGLNGLGTPLRAGRAGTFSVRPR